jgi:hypothetical protein
VPKQIDHVVILVRELARAASDYAAAGFAVTPGGEHTTGGTHNALIGFADGTYLELIAFREPERPQAHRWWIRLADGEGFVDYALLSSDLAAEVPELRTRGLEVADPGEGGRLRPDGQRVGWRNLMLVPVPCEAGQPFLIEDTTPRELRVPSGPQAVHPLGVTRVAGLTLVVSDLAVASGQLGALLDDDGRLSEGDGERMLFTVGRQWLELLQPDDPASDAGRQLVAFGDSPFELVLSAGGDEVGPGEGELLPVVTLHGARIRVAR